MSWKPDNQNLAEYHSGSDFVQGVIISVITFMVLIYNWRGPKWIKGFICSLFLGYIFLTIEASLTFALTQFHKSDSSLERKLLRKISIVADCIYWQIFFGTHILFTLFYWVTAKYNEHVISVKIANEEVSHRQSITFDPKH